ncbi:hypothetical protein EDD16DRAFT_1807391 [Pisolithus croceorrhizus]|nr:hypothetical protein EDD16DRAFT_1807391 [Pisolithus croceorrhizus]KAI6144878.1 hypothetical protein EDD17DRAFT_1781319 [Pisolithus thermaeus]
MSPSSPKMLLVFCDGTGADGTLTSTEGELCMSDARFTPPAHLHRPPTNVLRLCESPPVINGDNQKRQIVLYMSGVGSESNFHGVPSPPGVALRCVIVPASNKIRDAYAFIAQNYEVGDEICIFGGAYTARKLSGLIDRIGLLQREELIYFFEIWTALDALSITDHSLPANIDIALHALSLQDNRTLFSPTLWEMPEGGRLANQVIKQVWFPGSHSDVGGGCDKHDLSDLALFWMVGEIKSFINIDTSFIEKMTQPQTGQWGAAEPQNAYIEFGGGSPQTRLEGGLIKPDILLHESILHAPTTLLKPDHMLTLDTLKEVFGSSWKPIIAPLNEFEQSCKDKWGKQSERYTSADHGATIPQTVTFESASDLSL